MPSVRCGAHRRRLFSSVLTGLLLAGQGACLWGPPTVASPQTVGQDVRISFAEPREVIGVREGGDSLLIVAVQRISGRLVAMAGDTAVLRPVTSVETLNGPVAFRSTDPGVAARIVGPSASAAAAQRPSAWGRALTVALVVVLGLGVLLAAAWGEGPGG